MSVQMIELEIVEINIVSDEALEAAVGKVMGWRMTDMTCRNCY